MPNNKTAEFKMLQKINTNVHGVRVKMFTSDDLFGSAFICKHQDKSFKKQIPYFGKCSHQDIEKSFNFYL